MARGDQIYVIRPFLKMEGVYQHHGIDCGHGQVIHYRKTDQEKITCTSRETFTQGQKVYLKSYQVAFVPDVVIQRAESRLGEQQYNLLFNNCEHFANWCKTGISESQQIKNFVPIISRLNTENLYNPLEQALKETDVNNAERILKEALAEIRVAWDSIQPQYNQVLGEIETWQKVAWEAVKRDRDDLAKAALKRKRQQEQKAQKLQQKLEHLATMTETLLRNRYGVQP